MKNLIYTLTPLILSPLLAQGATIVYQDNFDDDTLATNTSTGGGMTSRTLRGGNHLWEDNGNLQFTTTGNTHYLNRVIAYSNNTFQSTEGFKLNVSFFQTSYAGASNLAFGLISDDTDLSTYTGNDPFSNAATYGFGVSADAGDLSSTNGTTTSVLDDEAQFTTSTTHAVEIIFENNGTGGADWSWSLGGTSRGTGTIAAFDFSKDYQFVAYGQDDQGNKRIDSVSLTAIPEPSSSALFLLSSLGLIARRRR